MPSIDWTPGPGRRGRPVRRVLGIDQRQGLIILGSLAAVMVLLAGYTLLGGFSGGKHPVFQGTVRGSSGSGGNGVDSQPTVMPTNAAGALQTVKDSTQHYAAMFTTGRQIVGEQGYASMQDYAKAFADPASAASRFAKFRNDPNPEADTSYLGAFGQAAAILGSSKALDRWEKDMGTVHADLAAWVGTAARFQQGAVTRAEADAAAAAVSASLAAARTDAAAVAS